MHKKVCIFVDGENLRHSIEDLFPLYDKKEYLPKSAEWTQFFDHITLKAGGDDAERIRSYWYVVQNIDFSPFNINAAKKDDELLRKLLSRDTEIEKVLSASLKPKEEMQKFANNLLGLQQMMERRFSGWINIQDSIARTFTAVEFRRAGSIRYDLFKKTLGSEKSVDVKLATDLIKLKDIYDIAVIVSGDQDYVPAVEVVKDYGKRTVSVAFQKEDGHLLPGGAKRLSQTTDQNIEMKFFDLRKYLKC